MDLVYLRDHIKEELDGAKDYVKRAIEIKPMEAAWGKMMLDMSAQELNHAAFLYNMFNEYCAIMAKSYTEIPPYVQTMRDEVVEMYTECTAKIKSMHEMYAK